LSFLIFNKLRYYSNRRWRTASQRSYNNWYKLCYPTHSLYSF